jgi:hypothetical protein
MPPRLFLAVLFPALLVAAVPTALGADGPAAALAAKAEAIVDHWDGDPKQLDEAKAAIEEAVRLDPSSRHYRGVQARQILLAGTSEDGIRQSALGQAHGILFGAALEGNPADARVFAFLTQVRIALKQDKTYWAVTSAEKADPKDPWVKWAWAQYYASEHDVAGQMRSLDEAVAAGLPNPIELRKAYDLLLPNYAATRERVKFDAAYAGRARLDPRDAYLRGNAARDLATWFQDFPAAERLAREALALADYPQARQTLSLSLYGAWAQAARDGKGADVIQARFAKAHAFDPGGHLIPTCLAGWQPLEYVFTRLEEKRIRREDMHQC